LGGDQGLDYADRRSGISGPLGKCLDVVDSWRLGELVLEGPGRRLSRNGQRVEADTQQVELLLHLVRGYPEIVGKDALIEGIWGGAYVTEAALQKTVSALRRTLRELGLPEDTVETRHRRGYQLTLAPLPVVAAAPAMPEADTVEFAASGGAPPRTRSSGATLGFALALMALVAAGAWWWMRAVPEPAEATVPVPSPIDAEQHAQRLRGLDDATLQSTIRDALASDPPFAAAAVRELRGRGTTNAAWVALADKFDGILAYRAGQFDAARAHYERALAGFEALDDRREQSNVLNNLAILLAESGRDPARAETLYRQSLALRELLGDAALVMASHRNLSNLLLEQGRLDAAREAVAAYVEAAERIGAPVDRGEALLLRGDVLRDSGTDARDLYRQAAEFGSAQGLPVVAASAWQRLGREALRLRDPGTARDAFEAAIALYQQSDPGHQLPWLKYQWAEAVAAAGDPAAAVSAYAEVLVLSEGLTDSSLAIDARLALSLLLMQAGRAAEAEAHLADASRLALTLGNAMTSANVALTRFEASLRRDQRVAARGHLEAARRFAQEVGSESLAREVRLREAMLMIAEGSHAAARQALADADAAAIARGDQQERERIDRLGAMLSLAEGRFADGYVVLERPSAPNLDATVAPAEPVRMAWPSFVAGMLAGLLVFWGALALRRFAGAPARATAKMAVSRATADAPAQ
jgi:DNA-binding winged helix-turn-helix (wHTH) protein/tetratricopeptide (TPR) repeat protein